MIYIHRHQFNRDGTTISRTGLLARVRLSDWSEQVVLPHERTTRGPREERLDRLRAVQANLSPLYFLYRDSDSEIRKGLSGNICRCTGYTDIVRSVRKAAEALSEAGKVRSPSGHVSKVPA